MPCTLINNFYIFSLVPTSLRQMTDYFIYIFWTGSNDSRYLEDKTTTKPNFICRQILTIKVEVER